MMRVIITVRWDGLLPKEKVIRRYGIPEKKRYLPPAGEPPYITEESYKKLDFLMKSILLIWRISISVTVPEFMGMKTGSSPQLWFIMRAAAPADLLTINLKSGIHPETASI